MAQITLNSSGVASNGSLLLQSNGTTTAVTIDTAQNMGLGVTPQAWNLDTRMIDVGASVSMGNAFGGPASLVYNAVQSTASSGAWKYRLAASVAAGLYTIDSAHKWFTAAAGTAGNTISFTQAMTLDSSGNLLVGTTTASGRLTVSSDVSLTNRVALFSSTYSGGDSAYEAIGIVKYENSTATTNIFQRFFINQGGNGSGQINANGANAAAFGSYSDARLKENIVDLPPQLDNIMALRPVEYDYIESEGGGHQIGFVAQEVQAIYPDLIGERADGMLTLSDMNKNDARLIKAIQELKALVDTQASTITQLQADVAALKGTA